MVTGGEIWLLPVLWQIPELKQAPNKLWALQCLGKKPRCLLSYLEWNYYLPPSLNISFQHQKYKPQFEKHISVTIPRAVIMFSVTCSPDLNTCNRLVNLWVICIKNRQVYLQHQGPIKHTQPWQVLQVTTLIDSPACTDVPYWISSLTSPCWLMMGAAYSWFTSCNRHSRNTLATPIRVWHSTSKNKSRFSSCQEIELSCVISKLLPNPIDHKVNKIR